MYASGLRSGGGEEEAEKENQLFSEIVGEGGGGGDGHWASCTGSGLCLSLRLDSRGMVGSLIYNQKKPSQWASLGMGGPQKTFSLIFTFREKYKHIK